MADRPRILITRAEEVTGERWNDYADRVEAAGGEITITSPPGEGTSLLATLPLEITP